MAGTGLWNIGGVNLPDFGITERLGINQWNNPGLVTGAVQGNNLTQSSQPAQIPQLQYPTISNPLPGGSVLGAGTTGGTSAPATRTASTPTQQPSQPSQPSYEDQMRSSINSGWDSYLGQLNDMLNVGLPGQQAAQNQIAEQSYLSGKNTLGTQKASSEQAVAKQQAGSLKDLGANVRNLFQSGNIYLGARGAGDSSAANQYSYAISKMGTKARGDIMAQASDRLNQIGDIYNSEVNRLDTEKQTRLAQISDWFNSAQNQLRSQIGSAGLNKQKDLQALSQTIYNQALSAMQALQQETMNRRSMLESWAASNSKNVQELTQNMQQIQQMPAFNGLNSGMPQVTAEGNMYVPVGYGSTTEKKTGLFR